MKTFNKLNGFSLIEILIAITLIAITSFGIIKAVDPSVDKAKELKAQNIQHVKSDMEIINSLEFEGF